MRERVKQKIVEAARASGGSTRVIEGQEFVTGMLDAITDAVCRLVADSMNMEAEACLKDIVEGDDEGRLIACARAGGLMTEAAGYYESEVWKRSD